MMPQEEIKTEMQLNSLLLTFNQLSEETGSVENMLQILDYFHSFPEERKSCKTDKQGREGKEKACGTLHQYLPTTGDIG